MPVTDALGEERVVKLLTELLLDRALLDPKMQDALDATVVEFLARNPTALCAILGDAGLIDECPEIAIRLLRRAHERASTPTDRLWVANLARQSGCGDLFPKPKSNPPATLTQSQQRGLRRLEALAKLQFSGAVRQGIQLRTNPLIVGPSGVGKTNLVRQLAAKLELPVIKLTFGDWIVSGAKTEPSTLQRLQIALDRHPRLLIHLDELDKFQAGTDPWSRAMQGELFSVIDREPGCSGTVRNPWTPEHAEKLRRHTLIIGSGTWQNLWSARQSNAIGFGRTAPTGDMIQRIRSAGIIPEELMNRFNADWIMLEPYSADDFREIALRLKLDTAVLDPIEAAASGLNFRAVEVALTAHSLRGLEAGTETQL